MGCTVDRPHQMFVPPNIGAARAGVVAGAEHVTDFIVLETGGEDISSAIGERVGDEDRGSVVHLADIIARFLRVERKAAGVSRAGHHGFGNRGSPLVEAPFLWRQPANIEVQRGVDELEKLGFDAMRGEQLEQAFARSDLAATVTSYVYDQTSLRKVSGRDYSSKLFHKFFRVLNVKAEQANVTDVFSVYAPDFRIENLFKARAHVDRTGSVQLSL